MKKVYPIVLTQGKEKIVVYVPDFNINTQGDDMADAMEMARDAIGLMGIDMEDEGEMLPEGSSFIAVKDEYPDDIVTLVDVDFAEYRRKNDLRAVKKTVRFHPGLTSKRKKPG